MKFSKFNQRIDKMLANRTALTKHTVLGNGDQLVIKVQTEVEHTEQVKTAEELRQEMIAKNKNAATIGIRYGK